MTTPKKCEMAVNFIEFLGKPDLFTREKSYYENPKHLYPRTFDDFHTIDLLKGCPSLFDKDPCSTVKCPQPCCVNYLDLNEN